MYFIRGCVIAALLSVTAAPVMAQDKKSEDSKVSAKQEKLEKAFAEKLSGSALVGAFTIDGRDDGKPPAKERYEIAKVSKLRDNYWVFRARIKYGKTDVTVPITLQVLWAGDTPMISMTDFSIPGMGTFTARVMFYGDRYAGTWQHGKVGGHMFGTIEPIKKKDAEKDKPKSDNPKSDK